MMMLSFGKGTFADSLLAVLAGFVVTAIVQSSSAVTGILIALASEGFLPIEASLPIIFGTNIGTCVTAMLSSIGANRTAKRAAFIHFMFNILGTIIFMIFFRGLTIRLVQMISPESAARQLANAHTFFNIVNTLLLFPFASILVKLANSIIPVKDYEMQEVNGIKHLDDRILETPSIAIVQVVKETLNMGHLALENYKKAIDAFVQKNEKLVHEVFKQEKTINQMEHAIAAYLVKLSNTALSAEQHEVVDGLFSTINDIERVGDHSDNLAELSLYVIEHDLCFSDIAMVELEEIHGKVVDAYTQSLDALQTGDLREANKVIQIEGEVDALEKSLRAHHIQRLNKQLCSPESGVIFLDMLSNLERIADHASNIAMAVIDRNRK
jgi:phosphate:Na+ symporter